MLVEQIKSSGSDHCQRGDKEKEARKAEIPLQMLYEDVNGRDPEPPTE